MIWVTEYREKEQERKDGRGLFMNEGAVVQMSIYIHRKCVGGS